MFKLLTSYVRFSDSLRVLNPKFSYYSQGVGVSMNKLLIATVPMLILFSCSQQKRSSEAYQLNLSQEPATLHPLNSQDAYATQVQSYILESLLNRDVDTNDWEGELASKWEISKDGKVFTFELNPNAVWSDGKPVTAEDVKFSFDAIFDNQFQTAHLRPYYEGLSKVEIVAPGKVAFHAKETYFKNFESAAGLTVIPKHIYGDPKMDKTQWNRNLVGSGPYLLAKYEKGQSITLEKNPKWWGITDANRKDEYLIPKIRLKFVGDTSVSLEMLKKGEIDFDVLDPEDYVSKTKGDGWGSKWIKVQTQNRSPKGYGFVGFNLRNPLFQDVNTRKALAHLFNRDLMIEKFLYNLSDKAAGPWHKSSEYASENVQPIPFDTDAARKLFIQAGWKDEDKNGVLERTHGGAKQELRWTLLLPTQEMEKYFTIFKEDLKKAGVEMSLQIVEWNAFTKILDENKFDAVALAWGAGSTDIDPKQIWHSSSSVKGGSNFIGYNNKEVDRLIDQARATMDKEKRIPILKKTFELIAADVPYIFMFNSRFIFYAHTKRVKKIKDTYNFGVGQKYWSLE
jgi:microcin C transport system substrate-binding protein